MRHKQLHLCLFLLAILPQAIFAQAKSHAANGVSLKARAMLQGALLGVPGTTGIMRDDLRADGYLPSNDPHRQLPGFYGEMPDVPVWNIIDPYQVFGVTGVDAIVDWVVLELRGGAFGENILAARPALLQRDGDIVELDGNSVVWFEGMNPDYYWVAVRHRNHLGIMSGEPISLAKIPVSLDFTNPDQPTYGSSAQVNLGGRMAMWFGDVNHDGKITIQGPVNDRDLLFFNVVADAENGQGNTNHIAHGYRNTDINLDGKTIYQGPKEDNGFLFFGLYSYFQNNCPGGNPCPLVAQLP